MGCEPAIGKRVSATFPIANTLPPAPHHQYLGIWGIINFSITAVRARMYFLFYNLKEDVSCGKSQADKTTKRIKTFKGLCYIRILA
jgi:hypothetical protein